MRSLPEEENEKDARLTVFQGTYLNPTVSECRNTRSMLCIWFDSNQLKISVYGMLHPGNFTIPLQVKILKGTTKYLHIEPRKSIVTDVY